MKKLIDKSKYEQIEILNNLHYKMKIVVVVGKQFSGDCNTCVINQFHDLEISLLVNIMNAHCVFAGRLIHTLKPSFLPLQVTFFFSQVPLFFFLSQTYCPLHHQFISRVYPLKRNTFLWSYDAHFSVKWQVYI